MLCKTFSMRKVNRADLHPAPLSVISLGADMGFLAKTADRHCRARVVRDRLNKVMR